MSLLSSIMEWRWVEGVTFMSSRYQVAAICVLYLLAIQAVKFAMKKRGPLTLKSMSIAYNVFQVVFSTILATCTVMAAVLQAYYHGVWSLVSIRIFSIVDC